MLSCSTSPFLCYCCSCCPATQPKSNYKSYVTGNFGFFLVQPIATHPYRFSGLFGVFNFDSCSCCSRRTPKMRCMFANATFTGGRATARSLENRSRGAVLSCRVRWHMRSGMRVPYHARAPQQREERSRFRHWSPPPPLYFISRWCCRAASLRARESAAVVEITVIVAPRHTRIVDGGRCDTAAVAVAPSAASDADGSASVELEKYDINFW